MIIKPLPPLSPHGKKKSIKRLLAITVYPIVVVVHVTYVALYKRNSLGLMTIRVKKLVLQFISLFTGIGKNILISYEPVQLHCFPDS